MSADERTDDRSGNGAGAGGGRLGVDIGGTFTDAVLIDGASRLHVGKSRTTPEELADGFAAAAESAIERAGVAHRSLDYVVHGTTVATNAVVQRRLAKVGLVTTLGFRDVLAIGTQQRDTLYDLRTPKAPPLVPRELRVEVEERIGPEGQVVVPLSPGSVESAAERLAAAGVEAVAVVFLFAFINPAHEEQAAEILARRLPGIPISLSAHVAPEHREYLRASTTVLNASLRPLVGTYVRRLSERIREQDLRVPLHLMQSNGGVTSAEIAGSLPVSIVASGPAAGALGGAKLAELVGRRDVLTFDMGGTTADVALVIDGEPQLRYRGEAGGQPINLPQLDVLSVGAGGGSIARVDDFGSLSVGPASAGSDPGPAAYGRGGEEPTVTDAHLVLGTIDPDRALAGGLRLDRDAALAAIQRRVAGPLALSPEAAAAAIIRLANATMIRALRVISVARGQDPRRCALVALGGAGAMHACALAEELGMESVIVPRYPGVGSALGLLLSDVRYDVRRSWVRDTSAISWSDLREQLTALERIGSANLATAGFGNGSGRIDFAVDMRYRGQAYEVTVPVDSERPTLEAMIEAFHEAHRHLYGHASPVEGTEVVTVRATATGPVAPPDWGALDGAGQASAARERQVWGLDGREWTYRVLARGALVPGEGLAGPAILEQEDSTIVVPDGWTVTTKVAGTAVIERGAP
jgi:N-methylhydantoinase A